ncbi:MAG: hypothetical protein MJZ19_01185 [Paludibacteraceae bacterium]|nr:hypothetical protein [Paludibacteraceae bacterium]
MLKDIANFLIKYKLETLLFVLCLFHYRIYYKLGICANIFAEVALGLFVILVIRRTVRKSLEGLEPEDFKFQSKLYTFFISAGFIFTYNVFGIKALEWSDMFSGRAEQEYGVIYSAKMINWKRVKFGTVATLERLDDPTQRFETGARILPDNYCLYIVPELGHYNEFGYFLVFPRRIIEARPTKVQLDYCTQGAKSTEKVDFLRRYSSRITQEELIDYLINYGRHDNRIIAAVVEKRGENYIYLNAKESDDKLWALKNNGRAVDGQKVLVVYDAKSPSLFYVLNWHPEPEEYEEHASPDGKSPSMKYMLLMEKLSKTARNTPMPQDSSAVQ